MQSQHNEVGARASYSGVLHRLRLIKSGWYKEQIGYAIKCAQDLGKQNHELEHAARLFNSKRSIKTRVSLSYLSIKYGRRKLVDRMVVSVIALLGYV